MPDITVAFTQATLERVRTVATEQLVAVDEVIRRFVEVGLMVYDDRDHIEGLSPAEKVPPPPVPSPLMQKWLDDRRKRAALSGAKATPPYPAPDANDDRRNTTEDADG